MDKKLTSWISERVTLVGSPFDGGRKNGFFVFQLGFTDSPIADGKAMLFLCFISCLLAEKATKEEKKKREFAGEAPWDF